MLLLPPVRTVLHVWLAAETCFMHLHPSECLCRFLHALHTDSARAIRSNQFSFCSWSYVSHAIVQLSIRHSNVMQILGGICLNIEVLPCFLLHHVGTSGSLVCETLSLAKTLLGLCKARACILSICLQVEAEAHRRAASYVNRALDCCFAD